MKNKNLIKAIIAVLAVVTATLQSNAQEVSRYAISDAVVHEAYPDSVIDQSAKGENLLAYKEKAGDELKRVFSYVKFDISNLKGTAVESASFSYRGKTGDAEFENLFKIELYGLKADFDEAVTWNSKPSQGSKLSESYLDASSARKSFDNIGTSIVDYINEEVRKGSSTIGFLLRSAEKDSTTNMWIGGEKNGAYGPILDMVITSEKTTYSLADAVVHEAYPDSAIDQGARGGNILAYRETINDGLTRVQSYVKFDISALAGMQVESASVSFRGKTGDADFEGLFKLDLYSIKADFAEDVTWNTKPAQDKKLSSVYLDASSARKSFDNIGTGIVDYINEALRKGHTTVAFLFKSAEKDSTTNMWIGGTANGAYGPILDYTVAPEGSGYSVMDAVVHQAYPDSAIDQGAKGGNILAYREKIDDQLQRVQSYVKFDISGLAGKQVESATVSFRGKTGDADFEDLFKLDLYSVKADFAENVTWNTMPGQDKKLASAYLDASSARKSFENAGTGIVDYINEALRVGQSTVAFLFKSAEKDSTTNMWIGGAENGAYGPILDYTIAPTGSGYGTGDAVVHEAYPDSVIDQSQKGGNLLTYKEKVGDALQQVSSLVMFDVSGLMGQQVTNATFSMRGRTGDADFENLFLLELYGLKADFDPDNVTWNTRPGKGSKLAMSFLDGSSARKDFENLGTSLVSYINEELRKGNSTIGLMVSSAGKDSTTNMWLGGVENGAYGPILSYETESVFGVENDTLQVLEDVYVDQARPDTNFETGEADMQVMTTNADTTKLVLMKFDIAGVKEGIGTATLTVRGDRKDPPAPDATFTINVYGGTDNAWASDQVTWNTSPEFDSTALATYTISGSGMHMITSPQLTEFVNQQVMAGNPYLTFVMAGKDTTEFRAWISSDDWVAATLALDYSTQDKGVMDDAFVKEADPDANFDDVTGMEIALDPENNSSREVYLKFDLEGARSNVVTATLSVRGDQQGETAASPREDFYIQVSGSNDISWDETTITWNNRPDAAGEPLVTYNILESKYHDLSSPELTNYVKSAIAQKKGYVTFVIRGKDETPGHNAWISSKAWRPAELLLDYRKVVADPEFTVDPGDYVPSVAVMLNTSTVGATIYYTIDGTDPDNSSLVYDDNTGVVLTDTATVKAIAYMEGMAPSGIVEATYNVAPVSPPVFDKTPLIDYLNEVTVYISAEPEGALIFYSDDGSDPSTPYNPETGIFLQQTTTLAARTVENVAEDPYMSPVVEATYTVVIPVEGIGEGPGGVGFMDNTITGQPENALWLRADAIMDETDMDTVALWPDVSGNANHAYNTYDPAGENNIPNTGEKQQPAPTYVEDGLNGLPVMRFGTEFENDRASLLIDDADNLDGGAGISLFVVMKRNEMYGDFAAIVQKRDIRGGPEAQAYVLEMNGGNDPHEIQFVIARDVFLRSGVEFGDQQFYLLNVELNNATEKAYFRSGGQELNNSTYRKIVQNVEAPVIVGGFQPIDVAEIAMYKSHLNKAQSTIVHNYLATKYGLSLTGGDGIQQLYSNQDYTSDLIGVGADLDLDGVTVGKHPSASAGGLELEMLGTFVEGDYVMTAHNGVDASDDNPAKVWERMWYLQPVGDPGKIAISFNFNSAGLEIPADASGYFLSRDTGDGFEALDAVPTFDGERITFELDKGYAGGVYAIGQGLPGGVAAPVIDPEPGVYEGSVTVTITGPEGATIYYTLDGSSPTDQSSQYSGPIEITATTTVKAIAYAPGADPSFITSATFDVTITGLADALERSVTLYPNPTESRVEVEISNDWVGKIQVRVTDLTGRVLDYFEMHKNGDVHRQELDIHAYGSGLYLVVLEHDEQKAVKRLLIE
jgi:hypothetical protein